MSHRHCKVWESHMSNIDNGLDMECGILHWTGENVFALYIYIYIYIYIWAPLNLVDKF